MNTRLQKYIVETGPVDDQSRWSSLRIGKCRLHSLVWIAFGAALGFPISAVAETGSSWTGWYGGASLGYGDVSSSLSGFEGDGGIGGLLGGYRYDFGQWIAGVEADYDWASIDLNNALGASLDSVYRLKFQGGTEIGSPYLGSSFLFATVGWAWADASAGSSDLSDDGWLVGAGVDYTTDNGWVIGGEILWHEFEDFDGTGIDVDATTFKARVAYRF